MFNKKSSLLLAIDYFHKKSILDIWQGSEYASELLRLNSGGCKIREYTGRLVHAKLITIISLQTKNFPLFWRHSWKYNIQVNESLTKVKEEWSTIKFDVFLLSFIFFIPMSQKTSAINISGGCYVLDASN